MVAIFIRQSLQDGGHMNTSLAARLLVVTACFGGVAAAHAADASTERSTMPDYCTNRDVNCVLPDTPAPIKSAVGATSATSSAGIGAPTTTAPSSGSPSTSSPTQSGSPAPPGIRRH